MQTEAVSERFADLDDWPTTAAVEAMWEGQLAAISAIRPALGAIAEAADASARRLMDGGRLLYAGAGTSGRIAVQDGVELGPTFGWPDSRLGYALAGGMGALSRSVELAEDDVGLSRADVAALGITAQDVLIGVAASGRTPYTIGALEAGNEAGALTIAIANNAPSKLLETGQIAICAETGSEIIAGSTRMKAGTAQKAILNMISTATMIACGRVYKGLMVDMVISNAKLQQRAQDMVHRLTGATQDAAAQALAVADGNIKAAVLVAMGAPRAQADTLLAAHNHILRSAIEAWHGAGGKVDRRAS